MHGCFLFLWASDSWGPQTIISGERHLVPESAKSIQAGIFALDSLDHRASKCTRMIKGAATLILGILEGPNSVVSRSSC